MDNTRVREIDLAVSHLSDEAATRYVDIDDPIDVCVYTECVNGALYKNEITVAEWEEWMSLRFHSVHVELDKLFKSDWRHHVQ